MTLIPGTGAHGSLYKMVAAVCLIASACAIAVVNAALAARMMQEE